MRLRFVRVGMVVALVAAGLVMAGTWTVRPPQAHAAEPNYLPNCFKDIIICRNGTAVPPPDPNKMSICKLVVPSREEPDVGFCIKRYGDLVFVKDQAADGRSAVVRVREVQQKGDTWQPSRFCKNSRGAGKWVRCDFNWQENRNYSVATAELEGSTKTMYNLGIILGFND